jgi:Xaa-Pro aminopeptidase
MAKATDGPAKRRAQRIFEHIRAMDDLDSEPDLLLIRNATEPALDLSFFYLTAVPGGLFEGSSVTAFPDGTVDLFTSPLEEESARNGRGYHVHVYGGSKGQGELVQEVIRDRLDGDPETIGLNAREITWASVKAIAKLFPKAQLVDVSPAIKAARMIKDEAEINALRRAADAVSKVGAEIPGYLEKGMTEKELAARIDYEVMRAGGDGKSFTTIVAFGPRTSEPHYHPQEHRLGKDEYVLCDFGAFVDRYASDITRTYFHGTPTKKHRRIYDIVLEAQEIGIRALVPGGKAGAVHEKVEKVIDATEFKGRFIHSTGHTIGLSVHDGGTLHPAVDMKLEPGQVWTCEPGIYLPGFGGVRIEDDILITTKGPDVLTTAPKEFIVVEA